VRVEAVDTTGAGDCFRRRLYRGCCFRRDPQDCLRAAVFCGSHSTRARGGIAGFPAREESTYGDPHCRANGGGGIRTPQLIYGLAEAAEELCLGEVRLYDLDPSRTRLMAALGEVRSPAS